jgi:hypothetical protein
MTTRSRILSARRPQTARTKKPVKITYQHSPYTTYGKFNPSSTQPISRKKEINKHATPLVGIMRDGTPYKTAARLDYESRIEK